MSLTLQLNIWLVAIPKFQGGGPSELSVAFKVVMSLETPERVGYYSPSQNTEFLSVVSVIGTANRTSFIHGHA